MSTLAHGVPDNVADGLAAVADGREQGAVVMQAAEEDAADDAPQEHGDPAEHSGLDRSVDGAGARDGREVVTHQDSGLGGDEVDTVVQLDCGGLAGGINAPLLCQPTAIEDIADDECSDSCKDDQDSQTDLLL